MRPSDLALLRQPGSPSLSPDGRAVVVAVTRLDLEADAYRSQLWRFRVGGKAPTQPLTRGWRDTEPRWSPDGAWIAFLRAERDAKPQLHVLPAAGGEARAVTDHPLGAGPAVWSPDGRRLAYVARVPEEGRYGTEEGVKPDKQPPRRITTLSYRLDNVGFTLDRRPQVFVVDPFAEDPEPAQVTSGDYDHAGVTWSPDGRRLAFASRRHESRERDRADDLFVADLDSSEIRAVTRSTMPVARPAWSPDGESLVFVSPGDLGPDGIRGAGRNLGLWRVPVDGSSPPVRLTDPETVHVAGTEGRPLVVVKDGVLVELAERGAVTLARIGADGSPTTLV
ncbi:MAG: TolB family protein, partial [Acidimicrobiales bacterium]